jgi:hypothetical protein
MCSSTAPLSLRNSSSCPVLDGPSVILPISACVKEKYSGEQDMQSHRFLLLPSVRCEKGSVPPQQGDPPQYKHFALFASAMNAAESGCCEIAHSSQNAADSPTLPLQMK